MNKIAVFVPAYNASATIAETLAGIDESAAFINDKVDVYVVDDRSKDNTIAVLQQLKFNNLNLQIFQNEKNLGERGTINKYFKDFQGRYEWIFLIHADDIPKKNWIADMISAIDEIGEDDQVFTVWSSFDVYLDETGQILPGDNEGAHHQRNRSSGEIRRYLRKVAASYHVSGAAINMRLFALLEGFDAGLPQYGDTDFFCRGFLRGFSDIYVAKSLTYYRITGGSVSSVSYNTNRDIREIKYLIGKFSEILTAGDKLSMMADASWKLQRRMAKALLRGKLSNVINSVKLLVTIPFWYR